MLHQISNVTEYNRYPVIFRECAKYFFGKKPSILSFGCSDGREVKTLRDLYFYDSVIDGVDISKQVIEECKNLHLDEKISFYNSEEFRGSRYDLIFCMSVLCRWPQTEHLSDCSQEYTFEQFETQVLALDKLLNENGLLVIYNANFLFTDTVLKNKYRVMESDVLVESGFVKKFDKKNKAIEKAYRYSIFIKLSYWERLFQYCKRFFR